MHSALSLQGTGDVQNLCSESAEQILCSTTTVNCTIFDIYNDSTWVISSVNLILYAFVYCAYLQILGDDAYVLRIFDTSWRCWHMVQTIALPGSQAFCVWSEKTFPKIDGFEAHCPLCLMSRRVYSNSIGQTWVPAACNTIWTWTGIWGPCYSTSGAPHWNVCCFFRPH